MRVAPDNGLKSFHSSLGSHDQLIESIAHESSPQTDALAWAEPVPELTSESFDEPGCTARRFFDCGAQTTRHDILQSTGTVQLFVIDSSTVSSSLSA